VRKSIVLLVLLVSLVSVSNSEEQKLPEGFVLVETSSPYKMVLTPYATYPVTVEYLVPKVVLEGKWGSGPGEFGYVQNTDPEVSSSEYLGPEKVEINSKGEMYVLDTYNNRIQKFSKDGRYIKSIKVLSSADKTGKRALNNPYFDGYSILIDSEDNLYYMVRIGKSKEVRLYRDDNYIKMWDVSRVESSGLIIGMFPQGREEVWIAEKYYDDNSKGWVFNVTEGRYYSAQEYFKIDLENYNKRKVKIVFDKEEQGLLYHKIFAIDGSKSEIITKTYIGGCEGVRLRDGSYRIGFGKKTGYFSYGYYKNGFLKKMFYEPSIELRLIRQDGDGNPLVGYSIMDEKGIKFTRYVLEKR